MTFVTTEGVPECYPTAQ